MSVVFKCDRCGEIFNRKVPDINDCYGTANSILFLDCTVERNRFGLGEEPIQLCPSCMKELNDWLEPNKEKLWDYTHSEQLPVNPLYCEGQKRVGCIGCPMSGRGGRQREFMRWPAYEKMYISAFERMLDVRKEKVYRATGRPAWTFFAGGWKMTTSVVN